jgi:hypothetical protein
VVDDDAHLDGGGRRPEAREEAERDAKAAEGFMSALAAVGPIPAMSFGQPCGMSIRPAVNSSKLAQRRDHEFRARSEHPHQA